VTRTPAILQRRSIWEWLTSCFGSGNGYERAEGQSQDVELGVRESPPKPPTVMPEPRQPTLHTVMQNATATVRIGERVHGGLVTSCAMVLAYGEGNDLVGVYHWPGFVPNQGYLATFREVCSRVHPLGRIFIVSNNFLRQKKIRDAYIKAAREVRTAFEVTTRYLVIDSASDQTPFLTLTSEGPEGVAQSLKDIDLDTDLSSDKYL